MLENSIIEFFMALKADFIKAHKMSIPALDKEWRIEKMAVLNARQQTKPDDFKSKVIEFFSSPRRNTLFFGIGIFIVSLILNPCVLIPAGSRGVVLNAGAVSGRVMDEGLNFKIPIYQSVVKIDTRVVKYKINSEAASKDIQDVQTELAINHHIDREKVNFLYQKIGLEYEEKIISPAVHETMKAVTAKYTATELITQREKVKSEIEIMLSERLAKFYISIDAVSIENFKFSKTFTEAIEAKQQAEQLALKATRDLDRIKTEAEQKITTARAEAEEYRLKTMAITPLMRDMKWIEKWDGELPNYMGSGTPLIQIPNN